MKKDKKTQTLLISLISVAATSIVLSIGISIALFRNTVGGNGTYGEVSLRSYYDSGSGTEDDPFVITRPRHLYNLSRLHGLGLYGGDNKTYFQLGKVDLNGVPSNGVPMCYANDETSLIPYLDMSSSDRDNNPINAIGSEALPFYGEFDGQNVEIKGLNVYANPQDAGLFGYTAHGSKVYNLFLSDVTIHALGYTDDDYHLYNPSSTVGANAKFIYNSNDGVAAPIDLIPGYQDTEYSYFFANNISDFEYTAEGSSPIPTISLYDPGGDYTFSYLLSGDLITSDSNGAIIPNLSQVFSFFKNEKEELTADAFPLQASSSASLVVSSIDGYGQKHSKVLFTVEFDFTLDTIASNFISLGVHIGGSHENNIGLIAGHCDGTVYNCYVYNGSFEMNDGGAGYYKMSNGSDLGLIGHVGGTVENILALESDVGVKEGKSIGVLDFTTIASDVLKDNNASFSGSTTVSGTPVSGKTFAPKPTTKYEQYLRKNGSGNYVTWKNGSVSFKGQSIVWNTDLGVFKVATDPATTGYGDNAGINLSSSAILTENCAIKDAEDNDNYYLYYATGEYNKEYNDDYFGGSAFGSYQNSYNSQNPTHMAVGYHFPSRDQLSRESFEVREARQNYFIRFKLDARNRQGKGFYFSDLNTETDGGAYLSKYFNYKLVDQNSHHIPVGDNKCGVMLKNNLRKDISSFAGSFATQDLTQSAGGLDTVVYCLQDADENRFVGNAINFEIKNEKANVTVVAAPSDRSKPAILGVYKMDNEDFEGSVGTHDLHFTQRYDNPDYAFFMPDDNNLAYFDYQVLVDHSDNDKKKGEIGIVNNSTGELDNIATNETNATVAKAYNANLFPYSTSTDNDAINKPRLFVHTFCLPRGRYCLGSASTGSQSVPKVYYVCAQGQDDGQFDFDDNVFAGVDRVENIDFLSVPRFALDGTENITINRDEYDQDVQTTYNPSLYNDVPNRRLYVALVNSDRSEFGNALTSDLSFTYNPSNGKFIISSSLERSPFTQQQLNSVMLHVAVDNYNHSLENGDDKELTVVLLGIESDGSVIVYPPDN